jgi:hypothetical protein
MQSVGLEPELPRQTGRGGKRGGSAAAKAASSAGRRIIVDVYKNQALLKDFAAWALACAEQLCKVSYHVIFSNKC